MQVLFQDLRYWFRQLINSPGFTSTALISLAPEIGVTTAVFSVIHATLMNPYPYPSANRMMRLTVDSKSGSADWANLNGPQIQQMCQLRVIEGVLAMDFHAIPWAPRVADLQTLGCKSSVSSTMPKTTACANR